MITLPPVLSSTREEQSDELALLLLFSCPLTLLLLMKLNEILQSVTKLWASCNRNRRGIKNLRMERWNSRAESDWNNKACRLACRLWAVVVVTERWRAEIPSSHCRSGKSRRRPRRVAVFKSSRRGRRRWRSAGLQLQWGWCSSCLCRLICRRLGCSRHQWTSCGPPCASAAAAIPVCEGLSYHSKSKHIRASLEMPWQERLDWEIGTLIRVHTRFFLLAFHKRDVETSVDGPCLLICSYFFLYAWFNLTVVWPFLYFYFLKFRGSTIDSVFYQMQLENVLNK
jgi:hypothetical protein